MIDQNKNGAVISTNGLDVGYGKQIVVENINIDALKGQMICLLGPNGAGKTTILRTISGLLAPVSGCVHVGGKELSGMHKKEVAQYMSVVLTERININLMTAYDIVAIGRSPYTNFLGRMDEEDRVLIKKSLEMVDATHLTNRYFSEMSDGEKQKVMIARALVQEPELIVLDEPTTHLDVRHKTEVVRILHSLVREKNITVILSLHDIDLAIKGCQTVLLVRDGQVIGHGMPEDIIKEGSISSLYKLSEQEYNELLGSIEINIGSTNNDCFVVGGNGTAVRVYRALTREGHGLSTGILQENDVDYVIAKSLCEHIVAEKPFMPFAPHRIQEAESMMRKSKCVIDTGFPIGVNNKCNEDLLRTAAEQGQSVFSIRDQQELHNILNGGMENVRVCDSISELIMCINSFVLEPV